MKRHPHFARVLNAPLLALLGFLALGGVETASSAVIDLFSESPQILSLDASAKYISQTTALAGSPFTSRFASLSGGAQQLAITTESSQASYSFALSSGNSGQFCLTYTPDKGKTVDLSGNGETGILFHFENLKLSSPAAVMVGYYSTQWKGSVQVTLSGTEASEQLFVPFSAFPSKPGDFSKITSLSITTRDLQPGDSFSMGPITTIPEVSSPALLALAAMCLIGKRRR